MYGDIKITLVESETLAEYAVRTFALERVRPCPCLPCLRDRPPRAPLTLHSLAFMSILFI